MSNSHDNDDWSNDSASLFAEARRSHDPSLAESARLAAVLARIQTGKAEASFTANRGADIVARAATSEMLRLVASVSLGLVCIAAAAYAFIRFNGNSSELARSAKPAPTVAASSPLPVVAQPAIEAPALRGGASSARDEAQARPGSQRRRSRATAEGRRSSRIEAASVPEASSSAPQNNSKSVTAPETSATRDGATSGTDIAPALRSSAIAPSPQEAVTAAARKADPTQTLPDDARTELAMMKRIQAVLRDTDFSTVLAMCAEHARRWPHGVFELEREGVRTIASCGANSDDAALRAKRFLTAHPHAPVAMRVSAACATQLMKR